MFKYKKGLSRHLDDWLEIVLKKKQPVCEDIIKNAELVLKILKKPGIYIDPEKIEDCINLIEKYKPYKLAPVQRYIHACISGIFYKDGRNVFDEFFLYIARGFGKNTILSDSGFYLLTNKHGILNYNVDIVANSEDQAETSFKDVYEIVERYPELDDAFYRSKSVLKFINTSSEMKYYTSNAKTKDGLRPGLVAFDEVHMYEEYDNINVFTSALGKVPNARLMYLTTDGYIREGVLDDFKETARNVLDGLDEEVGFFPFMCHLDSFDEWKTEEGWIKANPMLPYLPNLMVRYKKDFAKAKKNQQQKLEFLTKRCNFPMIDTTTVPASREELLEASKPLPDLKGFQCVGAIDYAETKDFISVGLLFKKGDIRYWMQHTFIMEENLKTGIYNEKLLNEAKLKGSYTVLPGKVANPDYIANWFVEKQKDYIIKKVVGDRFRISIVSEAFSRVGIPFEEVGSGWISHNKIAPLITQLFGMNQIIWGDDPLMRWYTNNTKVVTDPKGNKTYHKIEKERRKNDGFMALIHALSSESVIVNQNANYNYGLKTYKY